MIPSTAEVIYEDVDTGLTMFHDRDFLPPVSYESVLEVRPMFEVLPQHPQSEITCGFCLSVPFQYIDRKPTWSKLSDDPAMLRRAHP